MSELLLHICGDCFCQIALRWVQSVLYIVGWVRDWLDFVMGWVMEFGHAVNSGRGHNYIWVSTLQLNSIIAWMTFTSTARIISTNQFSWWSFIVIIEFVKEFANFFRMVQFVLHAWTTYSAVDSVHESLQTFSENIISFSLHRCTRETTVLLLFVLCQIRTVMVLAITCLIFTILLTLLVITFNMIVRDVDDYVSRIVSSLWNKRFLNMIFCFKTTK